MIMQPEEEEGNEQRLNWRKDGSPQQRCPSRGWRISSLGPAWLRGKVGRSHDEKLFWLAESGPSDTKSEF